MEQRSQKLNNELEYNLQLIHSCSSEPLIFAQSAVNIIVEILDKLKSICIQYQFQNEEEEIRFFKQIKPQFTSKLIYYNEIYTIETNCPFGTVKEVRKYLNKQLEKLKVFYQDNADFYKYYKKGNCYLDQHYFLRDKFDIKFSLDSHYLLEDKRFATCHDFKVAQILANDLIKEYLESQLLYLEQKAKINNSKATESPLKWTGSKVSLTELIYALHTEGAFNNGSADLQLMVRFFEKSFHIELGQFHRTFFEISARKCDRTKFLIGLQEKLIRRMEDKNGI